MKEPTATVWLPALRRTPDRGLPISDATVLALLAAALDGFDSAAADRVASRVACDPSLAVWWHDQGLPWPDDAADLDRLPSIDCHDLWRRLIESLVTFPTKPNVSRKLARSSIRSVARARCAQHRAIQAEAEPTTVGLLAGAVAADLGVFVGRRGTGPTAASENGVLFLLRGCVRRCPTARPRSVCAACRARGGKTSAVRRPSVGCGGRTIRLEGDLSGDTTAAAPDVAAVAGTRSTRAGVFAAVGDREAAGNERTRLRRQSRNQQPVGQHFLARSCCCAMKRTPSGGAVCRRSVARRSALTRCWQI